MDDVLYAVHLLEQQISVVSLYMHVDLQELIIPLSGCNKCNQ